MKPEKAHLVYHEQTNTTWSNCKDWEERWKTESIGYGTIEIDIPNIFEMKHYMEKDGYALVKNDPFRILNGASDIVNGEGIK